MSTHTHAARRESAFARLAARFRPAAPADDLDEATRTAFATASSRQLLTRQDLTAMFPAPAPHGIGTPETLAAIVAEAQAGTSTESWGPWDRPDGLLMDERDHYTPPQRPYLPEPTAEDWLAADIRDLPGFRGTIRARARYFHRGCQCERLSTAGSAGWLASQYADMGPVAFPWRAAEPVQAVPVQSDDTLTWRAAA